nr:PD-(D/E)XK nuclease domain-containing protein [Fretibacterium sp.]
VTVQFPEQVIVLEFKYAKNSSEVNRRRSEGEKQIQEKNYTKPHEAGTQGVSAAVIVIDGEKREAVC